MAISSATAPATALAPMRAVSLNLCTDELLLALADPAQIASITHLAKDRRETALWRAAGRYPANDGSILDVARYRPDLIVTAGGAGRDGERLARAIGARLITLPYPSRLSDIVASIRLVAGALGRPMRGEAIVRGIDRLKASADARREPAGARRDPAVFVGNGGMSLPSTGAGADWLALAGFRQLPLGGERLDREQLLRLPPVTLIEGGYRKDQYSRADIRPVRRARDRHVAADGRRWTCLGPSLIPEILRLREARAR